MKVYPQRSRPLIQVQVHLEAAEQKLPGGLTTEVTSSNPGENLYRGCRTVLLDVSSTEVTPLIQVAFLLEAKVKNPPDKSSTLSDPLIYRGDKKI